MELILENINHALKDVLEPDLKKSIVELGLVSGIDIRGNVISFTVKVSSPALHSKKLVHDACVEHIRKTFGANVQVNINIQPLPGAKERTPELRKLLPGVKHIIAIASGKGGVGKSTITANLAVALAKRGAGVGLVDADIYGPSMPLMFNAVDQKPRVTEVLGKPIMEPLESHGVKLLSIGFFAESKQAIPWRGPMVSKALMQLFEDANWGKLDYLLVDLPPGTGDIHLTLIQKIPLTAAIIVSTPQEVALADARKGINMFQMQGLKVPILGLIENMAYYLYDGTSENRDYIFGKEGVKKLAEEMNIPLLGEIPLIRSVREAGDNGKPAALESGTLAESLFQEIAGKIERQLRNSDSIKEHMRITGG